MTHLWPRRGSDGRLGFGRDDGSAEDAALAGQAVEVRREADERRAENELKCIVMAQYSYGPIQLWPNMVMAYVAKQTNAAPNMELARYGETPTAVEVPPRGGQNLVAEVVLALSSVWQTERRGRSSVGPK